MINELITNMGHSTAQGMIGVPAIYIYMAIIVVVAFWRISQFNKEGH